MKLCRIEAALTRFLFCNVFGQEILLKKYLLRKRIESVPLRFMSTEETLAECIERMYINIP